MTSLAAQMFDELGYDPDDRRDERPALADVDAGLIEAAQAMGASRIQIIRKVLIPEAAPGLIASVASTAAGSTP